MARKKKKDFGGSCEVPIAAMIDVVFLLLIYFILNAREVVDEAWVAVNLPGPPPPEKPKETPPPTVDVYVLSDSYVYQGNHRSLDELEGTLAGFQSMGKDVTVNIKVSTRAKHFDLVMLLDRMSKYNLEKFNIHTLKEPLSK